MVKEEEINNREREYMFTLGTAVHTWLSVKQQWQQVTESMC